MDGALHVVAPLSGSGHTMYVGFFFFSVMIKSGNFLNLHLLVEAEWLPLRDCCFTFLANWNHCPEVITLTYLLVERLLPNDITQRYLS